MYRTTPKDLFSLDAEAVHLVRHGEHIEAKRLLKHLSIEVGGDLGAMYLRFIDFLDRLSTGDIENAFFFLCFHVELGGLPSSELGEAGVAICVPLLQEGGHDLLARWAMELLDYGAEDEHDFLALEEDTLQQASTSSAASLLAAKYWESGAKREQEEAVVGRVRALAEHDIAAAKIAARRAIKMFPDNLPLRFALVACLREAGSKAELQAVLEAAAESFPASESIELELAHHWKECGQQDAAIEAWWRGMRKNPRDLFTYMRFRCVLELAKRRDEHMKLVGEIRGTVGLSDASRSVVSKHLEETRSGVFPPVPWRGLHRPSHRLVHGD